MKSVCCAVLLFIASLLPLGAQGSGLAFRDDPDIARAVAEYIISGKVPVTNSFVYSGNEVAEILDYAGRLAKAEGFKSRLLFSFNPGVIGVSGIETYVPSPGSDPTLLYFLDSLPLFAELGATFSAGDRVAGKIKIDLAVRPTYVGINDIPLYAPWNIASVLRTVLSWKFPQESWISAGDRNSWIAVGRFKAGLGEGHFGNTLLNSRAEWYDQVQGVIGNENFRFTSLVGSSASHLYESEAKIQFRPRTLVDPASINPWDPINDHDFAPEMEALKVFAYHQIEARFWDRFRIGVAEMNMIGGKTPGLIDILPTSFWHNAYTAGFTNVMMTLSASLVPFRGMQLFGEFTLDDFRGADEGVEGKPAQYAWQAGGRYSFKPMKDLILTTGGEYTFANEWVYCRWQPYLTMYQRHLINPSQGTDWPLGFTYGPDSKHLGFYVNVSLADRATLELGYEHLVKGPIHMGMTDSAGNPIYYDYDDRTDITRTTSLAAIRALPEQLSHGLYLKASVQLPRGFEVYGRLQYWNHANYMNSSGDSRQFLLYSGGVLWKY